MIHLREIEFDYPNSDFQLRCSELRVDAGERVAVVGPSGCGKTTLLRLIAGIATPRAGCVEVCGEAVSAMSDAARRRFRATRVGQVFQDFGLLDHLSALDNILLPHRLTRGLRLSRETRERARGLAESMGIADKLRRAPDRLSHGERQRVAICRALVTEPRLLLADEPTGNLDPETARRIVDLLFAQVRERDATLLMVTHDHSLLENFDRVIDAREFPPALAGSD